MKSYNHLWEKFISDENYYLAIKNATKRKKNKKRRNRIARYYRTHADELKPRIMAYAMNFHNAEHTPKVIYDGISRKKRTILVPTMDEQIVHHMIVNVMKPIWSKGMYEHSYGSLPNKGGYRGMKTLKRWLRNSENNRNFKYCLKIDVKKFFDSIPHDILKAKLAKIIHDERFLNLLYTVIDATEVGLPLGFYTSQWLANWYLTELDHFMKEELGVKHNERYMDDMEMYSSNRRDLHRKRIAIDTYLQTHLGLKLKENWQVYLFDYVKYVKNEETNEIEEVHFGRDLDFMGYRFYRNKVILRKGVMLKASRRARRICKKPKKTIYDCRQMMSSLGWVKHTDTYGMYKKHIKPYVSFHQLKRRISYHDRKARGKLLCGESQKTATPQNL